MVVLHVLIYAGGKLLPSHSCGGVSCNKEITQGWWTLNSDIYTLYTVKVNSRMHLWFYNVHKWFYIAICTLYRSSWVSFFWMCSVSGRCRAGFCHFNSLLYSISLFTKWTPILFVFIVGVYEINLYSGHLEDFSPGLFGHTCTFWWWQHM